METIPLKIWPEMLVELFYSARLKKPREQLSLGENTKKKKKNTHKFCGYNLMV